MSRRPRGAGRVRWILIGAGVLVVAAAVRFAREPDPEPEGPRPLPARHVPDQERRHALRERLRRELGDGYDRPLAAATPEQLARGSALWEVLCAGCHASDARGRRTLSRMLPVSPGDLTDPERAAFYSDAAKLHLVTEGSDGTPMFAWKNMLSEQDRLAVTLHLRELVRGRRK